MIAGKTILAIIPARGGSKGVPKKNIRSLAGKPLIAWTIGEAKKSKYIDRIILSSEDEEIINVAEKYGCEVPFRRPAELAQDDTPGIEPVIHALNTLKENYDYLVLLQPTSPLRIVKDIDGCIEKCHGLGTSSCVSVCEADQSPYWMYTLDKDKKMNKLIEAEKTFVRRQVLPKVYSINGAIYVSRSEYIVAEKAFITHETTGYEMPRERSLDIDNMYDLKIAELILYDKLKV